MAEAKKEIELEIAHVLFIDIVGYSKLSINDQHAAVEELNQVVRASEQFHRAEAAERLLKIATGDGMALVFYTSPEAPVQCAVEISRALKEHPRLQLRMGIHSGPVSGLVDVNNRPNLTGAGINVAQRVMDCGDGGHILLSKHVAEDLEEYERWRPLLHDLGVCEVKHGVRIGVSNLHSDGVGNRELPKKFRVLKKRRTRMRWAAMAITLLALVAIVAGIAIFSLYRLRSTLTAPEKSIAVLPFENLSDDKENAYFTEGVGDEILTDLAKIADLKVISRTSVMQYKSGISRNLREIAEQLGVAYVLEGSVQRMRARVRVIVQLIDARTDAHLWAEHYDRPLDDVFAIQSEVAWAIADRLNAKPPGRKKRPLGNDPRPILSPTIFLCELKRFVPTQSFSSDCRKIAPGHASARAGDRARPDVFLACCRLAEAHDLIYFFGSDHTPERLALANTAIRPLCAYGPTLAKRTLLWRNISTAVTETTNTLSPNCLWRAAHIANDPLVLQLTGFVDRRQGRWEKSTNDLKRAASWIRGTSFVPTMSSHL
jgi:TolB-like protein